MNPGAPGLRYVERNALSAGLVKRAELWRWGSLWARDRSDDALLAMVCDGPVARPKDWAAWVNEAISERELERLELSERRKRPYGDDAWVGKTAGALRLEHTIRAEGRPTKVIKEGAT